MLKLDVLHEPRAIVCKVTAVGFEPTPLRNGALSHRLRPLGQTVMLVDTASCTPTSLKVA